MINKIPVSTITGNVVPFTYNIDEEKNTIPNIPFYDKLELITYRKGRSAINFIFKSLINNTEHSMFLSDFFDLIINNKLINGVVEGKWIYRKQGMNYGLTYIYEETEDGQ